MRQKVTTALEVAGMGAMAAAAALVDLRLGLAVGGAALLAAGIFGARQ
jgi:hypothetical protein